MAFAHKYAPLLKGYGRYLAGSTFGTSDIGKLVGFGTSDSLTYEKIQAPKGTTCNVTGFCGIFAGFDPGQSVASTNNSTSVFCLVQLIAPGEIIQAPYSTAVAKTAAANFMATTSIGRFFGLGGSTATLVGKYIDPSIASTLPGSTDGLFFKLMGFDTNAGVCWGIINTSHIVY